MTLSNAMADLAERIHDADRAAEAAARVTIEKAFEAGVLLLQAKQQCPHGQWLPFLERAHLGERRARRWMQLADSGLQIGHVTDLGGIRATLDFLTRWRLPEYGKALFISDAKFDGKYAEHQSVGRGIAYAWEDDQHRGHFNIGVIVGGGSDDADDECIMSKRPILPRLEAEGEDGPLDTIMHCLSEWLGPSLPIADWQIGFVESSFMYIVLHPFWTERTPRDAQAVTVKLTEAQ